MRNRFDTQLELLNKKLITLGGVLWERCFLAPDFPQSFR